MPQLDTSTWFTMIISTLMGLLIFFQTKIAKHPYPSYPTLKHNTLTPSKTPWENKWTKIYLPHSLPPQ
uniref:ATP synthase complex subunit 8 n=1 Tax=Exilisciurus exilis TaxID=226549 RepID=A0A161D0H7_EXIEI|nr:ATP synthase F0 subunit 8 [Exilisciurus exilis]ALP86370.1 ATP synthase F0 subunit 8 [Exilisciurus exilis]